MIAIKDMEMPKNCKECHLSHAYKEHDLLPTYYVCGYFGRNVYGGNEKEKDCPLREVKENADKGL